MKDLSTINAFARSLCKNRVYKHFKPGEAPLRSVEPVDFEIFVLHSDALICQWLNFWDKAAITIGEVVIFHIGYLTEARIRHEAIHVEQWRKKGWRFAWKYVLNPSKYEDPAEEAEKV